MKDRSKVFIRKFKLSSKLIIILFYEKHREYVYLCMEKNFFVGK